MFRKLFLINLSLFAAAVLSAMWLVDIWQSSLAAEIKTSPAAPKRIARSEYTFDKIEAGSGYELMVDRDLFRPDRKRYIPPEPKPKPKPLSEAEKKIKPNFCVVGIMILSETNKYAIVGEKPAKKIVPKKPAKRKRRSRRRPRKTKKAKTPPPENLLKAKSYRWGEEIKDGWFISEIKPTIVVFSNGTDTFEVSVDKSKIPEQDKVAESNKNEKRPGRKVTSPFTKRKPLPPDKDEATQRFLDALKKAGKKR